MLKDIRTLLRNSGMQRIYYMLLLLRMPFDALLTLVQAIFLKQAFRAIQCRDNPRLLEVCILFGIESLALFLYNGTVWSRFGPMCVRLGGRLRRAMLNKLCELPLRVIEEKSQGDIITRINQDTNMALQMLGGSVNIPHFAVAAVKVVAISVLLLVMDFKMFLLVWIALLPHILLNQIVIVKRMTQYQTEAQKAAGAATTVLSSMIDSAGAAILYDGQEYLLKEYEKCSKATLAAKMKIIWRNTLGTALIPLFGLGGFLVLLLAGGGMISKGIMSFGDLTAIFQYRGGVQSGVMLMLNCLGNLKINRAGAIRVNEIIGGQKDAA
jgi:ABC-type multidrug transport system fused ATPase/permease subunit